MYLRSANQVSAGVGLAASRADNPIGLTPADTLLEGSTYHCRGG
jgi:hypothetical protein